MSYETKQCSSMGADFTDHNFQPFARVSGSLNYEGWSVNAAMEKNCPELGLP
jgi:hypothetical protein